MDKINCEDFLVKMLAVIDGEQTDFSDEQTAEHLASCENCRQEIEKMQNTIVLLNKQTRREQDADLWSAIKRQIGAKSETASETNQQPFILLGILLVVYKLVEMLPERDFGWSLKIVPFVLIVALFGFLKENPFKINTELILEK